MHLVQGVFQFCLLGVLAGLLQQDRDVLGKQLGALAALTRHLGHGVVVDKFP